MILVIIVPVFIGIGYVNESYDREREERYAVGHISEKFDNIALELELRFTEVKRLVAESAPDVAADLTDPRRLSDVLHDLVECDSTIIGAAVAYVPGYFHENDSLFMLYKMRDMSDTIKTKTLKRENYYYPEKRWFIDAIKENRSVWSEPYFDEGGADLSMITYSCPIRDENGAIDAVLAVDMLLSRVLESLSEVQIYSPSYSFLLSESGSFVAPWNDGPGATGNLLKGADAERYPEVSDLARRILDDDPSGSTVITVNGEKVLAFYSSVPDLPWKMVYLCPCSSIFENLKDPRLLSTVLLLLLILLLCGGIFLMVGSEFATLREETVMDESKGSEGSVALYEKNEYERGLKLLHRYFLKMHHAMVDYVSDIRRNAESDNQLEYERVIARRLQQDLMSGMSMDNDSIDVCAMVQSCPGVGGDFYDGMIRDDKLYFIVADISGKGLPSLMFMTLAESLFRLIVRSYDSPVEIIKALNHAFSEGNVTNTFITSFVGVLDLSSGILDYCNAGYTPPVIITPSRGPVSLTVSPNVPLGIDSEFNFIGQSVRLWGSTLLICSDGVMRAENGQDVIFGRKRLISTLESMEIEAGSEEVVNRLTGELKSFIGSAELIDDMVMMCIRMNPERAAKLRSVQISADMLELPVISIFVNDLVKDGIVPHDKIDDINLVLEEMVGNVISYAYPSVVGGVVTLEAVESHGNTVVFILSDIGIPFDPTSAPLAERDGPLDSIEAGGNGIRIARNIMDSIEYRRLDNTNYLIMKKSF